MYIINILSILKTKRVVHALTNNIITNLLIIIDVFINQGYKKSFIFWFFNVRNYVTIKMIVK